MTRIERIRTVMSGGIPDRIPVMTHNFLMAAREAGVQPEACTVFDDSLSACSGARNARMRVVGVYDPYFAQDERAMRDFCDVYIKSFEELLWMLEERP